MVILFNRFPGVLFLLEKIKWFFMGVFGYTIRGCVAGLYSFVCVGPYLLFIRDLDAADKTHNRC